MSSEYEIDIVRRIRSLVSNPSFDCTFEANLHYWSLVNRYRNG